MISLSPTYHNSSENIATFTRSVHYNLIMARSPHFGSNISNLTRFYVYTIYIEAVAFARDFNLATTINLLHLYLYFNIGLDYTFNS